VNAFSLLALGSAALYGAADFIGGLTSRRADTMVVVLVSQGAGLLIVALALPLLGTPMPGRADWLWGGLAGLAGGIGVALLYRALAVGVMSLVAPVTAVCAVAVPVIVAVTVLGERPSWFAALGIVVALAAIVLVSHTNAGNGDANVDVLKDRRAGLGLALASGFAIGVFFLALARTSSDAGLWPLLFARISSVALFAVLVLGSRKSVRMPGAVALTIVAGGALDMAANLLYLLASRTGPLTLAVTLSSLYPASTVLLARVVLHERLTALQWGGVALALVAIVLIVRG
jgi:drug/metabolite transporter (DMT)-like permease